MDILIVLAIVAVAIVAAAAAMGLTPTTGKGGACSSGGCDGNVENGSCGETCGAPDGKPDPSRPCLADNGGSHGTKSR